MQMKNQISYISAILLIVFFSSCEEKKWAESDLDTVSIYEITDVSNGGPFALDVYQSKPLLIRYKDKSNVEGFETRNYSDASQDTVFNFQFEIQDSAVVTFNVESTVNDAVIISEKDSTIALDIMYRIFTDVSTDVAIDSMVIEEHWPSYGDVEAEVKEIKLTVEITDTEDFN